MFGPPPACSRQGALSAASQRPGLPRRRSPSGPCGATLSPSGGGSECHVPSLGCAEESERSGAGGGRERSSAARPGYWLVRRRRCHGLLAERRDPGRGHGRLPRPAGEEPLGARDEAPAVWGHLQAGAPGRSCPRGRCPAELTLRGLEEADVGARSPIPTYLGTPGAGELGPRGGGCCPPVGSVPSGGPP